MAFAATIGLSPDAKVEFPVSRPVCGVGISLLALSWIVAVTVTFRCWGD